MATQALPRYACRDRHPTLTTGSSTCGRCLPNSPKALRLAGSSVHSAAPDTLASASSQRGSFPLTSDHYVMRARSQLLALIHDH